MDTLLLMAVTCLLALGQALFKGAGLAIRGRPPAEMAWTLATLPIFYLSLAIYGVATLLWIFVLSRVPLSQAYPWVAAGIVIVPLLGYFFFDEQITWTYWAGMALIIAGLALTQLGGAVRSG